MSRSGEVSATAVTVRFWAAAREAAGLPEEHYPPATLDVVLASAVERHGDRLARVLARCAYLVDGNPVGARDRSKLALAAGSVLEVLPPFAGG